MQPSRAHVFMSCVRAVASQRLNSQERMSITVTSATNPCTALWHLSLDCCTHAARLSSFAACAIVSSALPFQMPHRRRRLSVSHCQNGGPRISMKEERDKTRSPLKPSLLFSPLLSPTLISRQNPRLLCMKKIESSRSRRRRQYRSLFGVPCLDGSKLIPLACFFSRPTRRSPLLSLPPSSLAHRVFATSLTLIV